MARKDKNSADWYVGSITDDQPRTAIVDLSFLPKGESYEAIIYQDGDDADFRTNPQSYKISSRKVNEKSKLKIKVARAVDLPFA